MAELVEGQILADARDVASQVYEVKAEGRLPVIRELPSNESQHLLEWVGIFRRTGREMGKGEQAGKWIGADSLRRSVVINERLRLFALNYLSSNGWDRDFVPTFEAKQESLFAKSFRTPAWKPIPE
jgi:hypothetical protein